MIFYIPRFRQGGLEKVFAKYLSNLSKFKMLTLLCDRNSINYLPEEILRNKSIKCVFLPNTRILRILKLWYYLIGSRESIINAIQSDALRPIIVLGIFFKLDVIYHERTFVSINKLTYLSKLIGFCRKPLLKILVNSEDQRVLFNDVFLDISVDRLFNPIINDDLKHLRSFRADHYTRGPNMRLVCSGRLDGQKNIRFILENAEVICSKTGFSKIIVYLSDWDDVQDYSCKYIELRKFSGSFLQDVVSLDAALVTTNFEGFSSLIFELAYIGIPVVCNEHQHGFDELNTIFNLTTFKRNNLEELITALQNFKQINHITLWDRDNVFDERSALASFNKKVMFD